MAGKSPTERFGGNLRQARERAGLSQASLARIVECNSSEVSRLERGLREPRLTTILRLARALHIDPVELLRGIR